MQKQGIIKNTFILTIASFICRSLGMFSIIYLSNTIGAEGVGLYQLIMTVYMMAIILASSGVSVAVSRLIAEAITIKKEEQVKKIMKTVVTYGLILSVLVTGILWIYAPLLANSFIQNTYAIWPLRILSFSIPFITVSACFKGYFYATKVAIKPASSDVLEQLIKILGLIVLVNLWGPYGLQKACAGIALSITIGEILSCTYMGTLYLVDRNRFKGKYLGNNKNRMGIFKQMLLIIIPIAIGAYIGSFLMTAENILIPIGLEKFGESQGNAISLYGIIKGMVLPLLFFPAAFLTAFATILVPEIASANKVNNTKRLHYTTGRVLQGTFLLSILVVSIFTFFADEIGMLLYKQKLVGDMLQILAFLIPFMYIEIVADSILKGLGQQVSSLKYSIIDSIFRVSAVYLFIPMKGVVGFIIIMVISNILTSTLNFQRLLKITKIKIKTTKWIVYPTLSALAAGLVAKLGLGYLQLIAVSLWVQVAVGIGMLTTVYFIFTFLLECITVEEVVQIRDSIKISG